MKNEIAILMAAGLGTRMLPLTEKTPKPLVKVLGKPMIETIIDGLVKREIKHIYVVVGYKKEQFNYLTTKYSNLTLIENKEYQTINNISSIHAVGDIMGSDDCFICEADLFIHDDSIFLNDFTHSCYYGKMVKGLSEDWVFEQDNDGRVIRVGKCGENCFNMCGVSFFRKYDALLIKEAINEAYNHPGRYENLFWDDIVNEQLNNVRVFVHPVEPSQIVEIDTINELNNVEKLFVVNK